MRIKGWDLSFFNSGEWQVIDERLKDLEKVNRRIHTDTFDPGDGYNPGRRELFKALRLIPSGEVRCCIIGQDPYPDSSFATGVAFSIGEDKGGPSNWPPTLRTFLNEYRTDLGLPLPRSGNLDKWSERGVLLWNAIPSCRSGKSLSHDWEEYSFLTREIIRILAKKGIVFALLGQVARRYLSDIDCVNNLVIVSSHPSNRSAKSGNTPFIGSRLFSTINDKLNSHALEPIAWRL